MMKNAAPRGALPSESGSKAGGAYAWYVVFVLILAYTMSFIDRQILTLMVQPIRKTLQITDLQLSLLHGFAFAIFYTILGVPIGRLIDRRRRTSVVAAGIVVWSCMTATCGIARNFAQLFTARIGVGIGEAALSPGAYSLLSDYFSPRQLPRALSVYTSAALVGGGIATMAGGLLVGLMPPLDLPLVGHLEPWQGVFLVIGLPGVLVALVVANLREPPRGGVKFAESPPFRAVIRYMRDRGAAFGLLFSGYSISSLMWNGTTSWLPTFFIRTFHWTPAEIGIRYGLAIMLCGATGVIGGGILATKIRERGHFDANLIVGLISLSISLPFGIAGALATSASLSLGLFCVFLISSAMPWGGAAAALQEITPNQMRGQVSAVYLFFVSLCGIGLGPVLVAALTEHLFHRDAAIGHSIALMMALSAPISALLLWRGCRPYRELLARDAA